jgi:hypothetical protein
MKQNPLIRHLVAGLAMVCILIMQSTSAFGSITRIENTDPINVSGTWKGTLSQPDATFSLSLYLTQTGSNIEGTSTISIGSAYATMNISGMLNGNKVNLQEGAIIASSGPLYLALDGA